MLLNTIGEMKGKRLDAPMIHWKNLMLKDKNGHAFINFAFAVFKMNLHKLKSIVEEIWMCFYYNNKLNLLLRHFYLQLLFHNL